jgi:hypothetical protein
MKKPLIQNAADEGQQKEAKESLQISRKSEMNALRASMSVEAFRRWMYQRVNICDRISVDASGSMTYFKEGERNMALKIKADLVDADPEAYLLMMKENSK